MLDVQDPCLLLQQVSVSFFTDEKLHTVLKEIDFTLRQGEWVSILGRNGSGKSTLAKVAAGLLPVNDGVRTGWEPEQSSMQMILQNPDAQIIGDTVYEDLAFSMENASVPFNQMTDTALHALQSVGIHCGLHEKTDVLSGGQKQLLSIAGGVASGASVIVLDEATSMLDPDSKQQVLQAIRQLHRKGKTIVWITQFLDELAADDRVIVLQEGSVLYDGHTLDFFYGEEEARTSGTGSGRPLRRCEAFGFVPPYAVRVAYALMDKGCKLPALPIRADELKEAVMALCRSR